MRHFRNCCLHLMVLLTFLSCRKPSGANWDVDVIVPVVNSRLNVTNFLPDTLFNADENGLLHLVYNREVASLKLDSLLSLPDTTITKDFTLPASVPLDPGSSITLFPPSEFIFDIGSGIELTRIDVRSGLLTVTFSNTITEPLDLDYLLPNITKNGKPLLISETVPPGNKSLVKVYDLSGYSFNLRGLSGNKYNTIAQAYTVTLNKAASPVVVPAGQGPKVDLSYGKVVPQLVEGYFGQQVIDMNETVDFGMISNFRAENFMLSEVNMKFQIVNEFGVDFSGGVSAVRSVNTSNSKTVTLNNQQMSNVQLTAATRGYESLTAQSKTYVFNNANSNIAAFISNLPDKLSYEGSISINPLGKVHGHTNFALYGKGVRIIADVDIPMRFSADRFLLESVAATDFTRVEQLEHANSGNFIVTASNGFPFTAKLQIYMVDESGQVIDSLFTADSGSILAGRLDAANDVVAPVTSTLLLPFDKARIQNLQRCKSLKIHPVFIMPPSPPDIRLLEAYEFDVNVVAELNYNVGIRR